MSVEAYLDRLRKDHTFFLRELWRLTGSESKAPLSWVELDMWDWECTGPQFSYVLAPRGIGKTHLITAAGTIRDLFLDPNHKTKIVSKTQDSAVETIRLIRRWIDSVPFLRHLAPPRNSWHADASRWFDVAGAEQGTRTYSVHAQGIEGQLEGGRAHTVRPDDVETRVNTKTLDARIDLEQRVSEFKAIASFDTNGRGSGGRIKGVGTPHHEESLYEKVAKKGYSVRTWSLVYLSPDEQALALGYAPKLAAQTAQNLAQPGDRVFPHRHSLQYIKDREAEGRTYFWMQYKLIAKVGDANRYPLRLSDFAVLALDRNQAPVGIMWGQQDHAGSTACQDIPSLGFDRDRFYRPAAIDPKFAPYSHTHMRIDQAGRGEDKVGVSIVAHLNGLFFVKFCMGLPGGATPANLRHIAQLARSHDARTCTCESQQGGDAWANLLQVEFNKLACTPNQNPAFPAGWGCSVTDPKPARGQKEVRICDTLEPFLASHRLVIDPAVARNEDLQYQLTRIQRSPRCLPHDDEIDSLAGAVDDLREFLRIDPAAAAEYDRREARQREIDEAIGIDRRPDDDCSVQHGAFFR